MGGCLRGASCVGGGLDWREVNDRGRVIGVPDSRTLGRREYWEALKRACGVKVERLEWVFDFARLIGCKWQNVNIRT